MQTRVKPICQIVGIDGNVFVIIGRVAATLKEVGQREEAREFTARAFKATSYNAVLAMLSEYVDVC